MSDFDFSAVTPETVSADDVKGSRSRSSKVLSTPVMGWLETCKANGSGMSVPVTSDAQIKELTSLLRTGAKLLDIGVRIVVANGKLSFKTAPKRAYNKAEDEDADSLDDSIKAHPAGKGRK